MSGQQREHHSLGVLPLAVALFVPLVTGVLGALIGRESRDEWYPTLNKPSWTPAGSTHRIVWTILYTLMGLASWLVWVFGRPERQKRSALRLYALHLPLNLLWSLLFFGLRCIGCALLEVVFLLLSVVAVTREFFRAQPVAAVLMLPHLIWTGLAMLLNGSFWLRNRVGSNGD